MRKKKILVIGGSYFIGRVFMLGAVRSEAHEFHVVNRGRYPLSLGGVAEYVCDRRDPAKLAGVLPQARWDVILDFCAEEPGDINTLLSAVPGGAEQYIYNSTCSVYDPDAPSPKTEDSPLRTCGGDHPGLAYAYNKRLLEEEAAGACAAGGIALTIIRPAFVYGPFNYAPRESLYFQHIIDKRPIPAPMDATGRFQFVFVKDIAAILMASLGNAETYGGIFNLAAPEVLTYERLLQVLENIYGSPLPVRPVSVAEVYEQNIPLPFPLDWDELFTGDKVSSLLGVPYTPFELGMRETYTIHMRSFGAGSGK